MPHPCETQDPSVYAIHSYAFTIFHNENVTCVTYITKRVLVTRTAHSKLSARRTPVTWGIPGDLTPVPPVLEEGCTQRVRRQRVMQTEREAGAGSPGPFPAEVPLPCYALWRFQRTEGNLIRWDPPLSCWSCISHGLSSVTRISWQYL